MAHSKEPVTALTEILADYREGEIPPLTGAHVERWVSQFDKGSQELLLQELSHVLRQTYFSRATVRSLLSSLVYTKKLVGSDPERFWSAANLFNGQGAGTSQANLLGLFSEVLDEEFGFGVTDCGSTSGPLVYLDDGVFSGNRILQDLQQWSSGGVRTGAKVHVIAAAIHTGAKWYVENRLKELKFQWWRMLEIENRKTYKNESSVLWPASVPDDRLVREYEASLRSAGFPPDLRKPVAGRSTIFSSQAGRHALEQEFLKAGCKIREMSSMLNQYQRPLGNIVLKTFGFGTTVVTYRNCPNNAPLALWAGDPWCPLLRRRTN
ncbi:MAG: hypothetical protein F4X25_00010 [Chloroflexi bacterium]|nr:hypothetical protein [Chloroflexota bacterium]